MPWGKTEDEKAAEQAEKDEARQAKADQRAAEAYWRTPVGKATAAFQNGDGFFQLESEVSALAGAPSGFGSSTNVIRHRGGPTDVLGQIEAIGWRLEHVGYVFIETGSTSTNRVLSTGQGTVTRGNVTGIYLFRREESVGEVSSV
jgi:hypothetical protein